MTRRRSLFASLALSLAFGLTLTGTLLACGGGVDGPTPLARRFDDSYIARLPVEQQGDIIKAEGDHAVAKREQAKADADLREAHDLVKIAKNEATAAKLDVSSAKTRLAAAEPTADRDRIDAAKKEQAAAEQAQGAADERVRYYGAYRDWLQQLLRYTQENTYWREAQYELAKARLAEKNNIAPSGFNVDNYVSQESARQKRAAAAKDKSNDARSKALEVRSRWQALQTAADQTLGKKSQFPDPMGAGMIEGGGDPTSGAGGSTIGGGGASSDGQVPPTEDAGGGGQVN